MPTRIWLRLAEIAVPVILAITMFVSWQADRRDRAELATQLAAAQRTIAQATADQHDRDSALNQTLAQLAAQKQAAMTPAQILQALPAALSLPAQITLQSPSSKSSSTTDAPAAKQSGQASPGQSTTLTDNPTPKAGQSQDAILPAADLKPLYDFALDCKACQAKITAVQSDLADEKTKSAALAKERDAAIKAAKGGSALRRIARAAKWFAIGAAAGAIAAKATH
jgi:cobalamin biosynthesis Mg chelatase CobN